MDIPKLLIKTLLITFLLFTSTVFAASEKPRHFPLGTQDVYIPKTPGVDVQKLKQIRTLVDQSISQGYYPGAVILAGHEGHIIYRGVFGSRRVLPNSAPMTYSTIFDIASLTKVVVTTTAIMQLAEQGKLDLSAPVAKYWPAFANQGKEKITVKQLLTHTSGLAEDIPSVDLASIAPEKTKNQTPVPWKGEAQALELVAQQHLLDPPGTVFRYSDINFITLGYLVEIISGQPLNKYASQHIFQPLAMKDTYFLPSKSIRSKIAPTQIIQKKLRWGEVHDPTVYEMGGIAGMAGAFSTAKDLGNFAECLLTGGTLKVKKSWHHLLSPDSVYAMTQSQTPSSVSVPHGLGWDIGSKYAAKGHLFSDQAYGHTGWTGTSLWIDPVSQTWLVILTSRTHPQPTKFNELIRDRNMIADLVAGSLS